MYTLILMLGLMLPESWQPEPVRNSVQPGRSCMLSIRICRKAEPFQCQNGQWQRLYAGIDGCQP